MSRLFCFGESIVSRLIRKTEACGIAIYNHKRCKVICCNSKFTTLVSGLNDRNLLSRLFILSENRRLHERVLEMTGEVAFDIRSRSSSHLRVHILNLKPGTTLIAVMSMDHVNVSNDVLTGIIRKQQTLIANVIPRPGMDRFITGSDRYNNVPEGGSDRVYKIDDVVVVNFAPCFFDRSIGTVEWFDSMKQLYELLDHYCDKYKLYKLRTCDMNSLVVTQGMVDYDDDGIEYIRDGSRGSHFNSLDNIITACAEINTYLISNRVNMYLKIGIDAGLVFATMLGSAKPQLMVAGTVIDECKALSSICPPRYLAICRHAYPYLNRSDNLITKLHFRNSGDVQPIHGRGGDRGAHDHMLYYLGSAEAPIMQAEGSSSVKLPDVFYSNIT